jgi:two-component system copper resistance phosphate regulon response regulator CusR
MKVLVVEDEPLMASFIARGLQDSGYAVEIASDGGRAIAAAENASFDLVILDLRLPVKDGLTVCRELRSNSFRSPILMLTADDYLAKPFDFDVLLARVRALLRRHRQLHDDVLRVGNLSLNTVDHAATRGDHVIKLTAKEYALLELLMLHQGQILSRAQIAEHVWDENFDPFSNTIDVYVKRLRRKIDHGSDQPLIHTRRSEGYMLASEIPDLSYV